MNTKSLAESYLKKALDRLDVLDLLFKKGAFSDVIRESQEIVELSLKGMLRFVGVEPPKIHDVGGLLLEHKDKFSQDISKRLKKLAEISKRLRKERELAFYGDIDFIPTEEYTREDAKEAIKDTRMVTKAAKELIKA
ncbi:MAG: HEPN domain-containing protein [Candidatus Aminicenantes bacterium]|nr:HEPN domain-containing protein [Candidatus Aminicenantes bacterium]